MKKMKNKKQIKFNWSWRRFSENVLELKSNKRKQSPKSVILSVTAAFLIVLFSAQILGAINNTVMSRHLLDTNRDARVLVYGNIG